MSYQDPEPSSANKNPLTPLILHDEIIAAAAEAGFVKLEPVIKKGRPTGQMRLVVPLTRTASAVICVRRRCCRWPRTWR